MFDRFLHSKSGTQPAPPPTAPVTPAGPTAPGDTATVRRIVAKLEAMPPDQARLLAAAAYTLARAANADLDISEDETSAIERELQEGEHIDEATAVMVTEMAKLQARTVGGTEDYVVTREFKSISTPELRLRVLRACFAIAAANGSISAEETSVLNQIAEELDIDDAALNAIRADYHEQLSSVQTLRRMTPAS
jgi:uncharacterized tellurite resistance protein B-like protein